MAPQIVLLDRQIDFSDDDDAVSGGGSIRWPWEVRGDAPSGQEISDAVTVYLRALKPQVVLADPPELSFLHILRPKSLGTPGQLYELASAYISSADKNLVALYAGEYRPGSRLLGGYLIYDAREDSISVIPKLPFDDSYNRAIGCQSAVVMREAAGDDYVLAELVWVWPRSSEAELWLWKSSAQEWILQPGSITLPSSNTRYFSADLCFSYGGSFLCWVDLLKGMVLCDLDQNCKFSIIQLPQECPTYDLYRPSPVAFRSMACVRGDIKFVALDEHQPGKGLELIVWTLSPGHSGGKWNISTKYDVGKIWANEAYQPTDKTTKAALSYPVLSIHEDGVIYLVVNEHRELEHGLECTGQSLLHLDMHNDKLQFCSKYPLNPLLFASDFSVHRQRLQGRPREIEGSEFGANGKRMKP